MSFRPAMGERRRWFDRQFDLGLSDDTFPGVVERIRGTPARLEELLDPVSRAKLVRRVEDDWSIQENVGHLLDLEPLWAGRLDDLLTGEERLRPADLENRKTHEADHNDQDVQDILKNFRAVRGATVAKLEALPPESLGSTALHPRLEQPMTAVDLFYFVAEHDDHHLARIAELIREIND